MYSLTKNEARVMNFLVRNSKERNSINEIGRKLDLSPNGIYKILKKLEKNKVIKAEKIGNAVYYKPNFDEEIGHKTAEFVLAQNELNNPTAKVYADDLRSLKGIAQSCMLFGSILTKGKEAKDVDVLIIVNEKDYKKLQKKLEEIRFISTRKIHDILMAPGDLANNLKKGNEAMVDMLQNCQILWGADVMVEEIKNAAA